MKRDSSLTSRPIVKQLIKILGVPAVIGWLGMREGGSRTFIGTNDLGGRSFLFSYLIINATFKQDLSIGVKVKLHLAASQASLANSMLVFRSTHLRGRTDGF